MKAAGATTWQGRRGTMILGPTEHRVARYLADMTGNGRVTIRTVDLVATLGLERSEVYRITARLRVLGLFGVENDRGGTNGGRRYWRTPIEHDGARLNAVRHRVAWSRVLAWARRRSDAIAARLAEIRGPQTAPGRTRSPGSSLAPAAVVVPSAAAGVTFRDLFRQAPGGVDLLRAWGLE